jgi:hypothetical protein
MSLDDLLLRAFEKGGVASFFNFSGLAMSMEYQNFKNVGMLELSP